MIEILFHVYCIFVIFHLLLLVTLTKQELSIGAKSQYYDFFEKARLSNWNKNILILAAVVSSLLWPLTIYKMLRNV